MFLTYNLVRDGDVMFTCWICLFVVLIGIEIVTINLVSIWFALGALSAAWISLLTDNLAIQVGAFTVISIVVLLIMRPVVKKFHKGKVVPTNLDRVIGKIGIVTEDIAPLKVGEVLVDGKKWSAISTKKIKKDQEVEILAIDGVKLKVKEKEEEK